MKVLHIDSSMRNSWSVSRQLSALFVKELQEKFNTAEIDYLDLAKDTPNHPSETMILGNYTPPADRSAEMLKALEESEALVDRLISADTYVMGVPMYNFTIPSNFKAFIDNIVRIGRTFKVEEYGSRGLLENKKVYIINTRGADFNNDYMVPMDQLVPYLKVIFHFIGLTDVHFIDVHPLQFSGQEARERAIEKAKADISELVKALNQKSYEG